MAVQYPDLCAGGLLLLVAHAIENGIKRIQTHNHPDIPLQTTLLHPLLTKQG
jgi:hypothetical protein